MQIQTIQIKDNVEEKSEVTYKISGRVFGQVLKSQPISKDTKVLLKDSSLFK